jgi:hypothetical protein
MELLGAIQLDNVQDVRVPGGFWRATTLANRLMKYTRRMYIMRAFPTCAPGIKLAIFDRARCQQQCNSADSAWWQGLEGRREREGITISSAIIKSEGLIIITADDGLKRQNEKCHPFKSRV